MESYVYIEFMNLSWLDSCFEKDFIALRSTLLGVKNLIVPKNLKISEI